MSKNYETPEIKVIPFEVEDILATSPGDTNTDTGAGGLPVLPGN